MNKQKPFFSKQKIAVPVIIGLCVAVYMLVTGVDFEQLKTIDWSYKTALWFFIALAMMATRDLAYMYRIQVLTDKKINWRTSFDVIMLWEFASAVTPSVVGGSGVAIYFVNKEGVSLGKSTAVVMVTAFLDELFYILTVPAVLLIIGTSHLFPVALQKEIFGITFGTKGVFWIGYFFMVLLTLIIIYGVFINPFGFKRILGRVFSLPVLKKWRKDAIKTGQDIIITSVELKSKPISYWLKSFVATCLAWTARYWVVNFIILAFTSVDNHLLIYGRQLVMWVIMLISPTPGGTGIAEFAFSGFLKDFIPQGLSGLLAIIWRLASYYPYIFMGVIILPKWLKRVYKK